MTTRQFRARQLRNRRGDRIDARNVRLSAQALAAKSRDGEDRLVVPSICRRYWRANPNHWFGFETHAGRDVDPHYPFNLDRGRRFDRASISRGQPATASAQTKAHADAARPHGGAMRLGRQRPDYHEAVACRPSTCSRGRCSAFGGRRHTGASPGGRVYDPERHRPAFHVALAKPASASIKMRVWAGTMPSPEPGGGHEAAHGQSATPDRQPRSVTFE